VEISRIFPLNFLPHLLYTFLCGKKIPHFLPALIILTNSECCTPPEKLLGAAGRQGFSYAAHRPVYQPSGMSVGLLGRDLFLETRDGYQKYNWYCRNDSKIFTLIDAIALPSSAQ